MKDESIDTMLDKLSTEQIFRLEGSLKKETLEGKSMHEYLYVKNYLKKRLNT